MKVVSSSGTIAGNCGVGYISNIGRDPGPRERGFWTTEVGTRNPGGIGMLVSGFVSTPECKAAYLQLCKKWKLVYQSPVRRNTNSGRKFFMAVFDSGKKIIPRGTW